MIGTTNTKLYRVEFFVPGQPKGQPRVKAYVRGIRAGVYDPGTANGWKNDVQRYFHSIDRPVASPKRSINLHLVFCMLRPKSHRTTQGRLRKGVSSEHVSKPDCTNLAKLVEDVLTDCGAWHDDSQISCLTISKLWCDDAKRQGCNIRYSWTEEVPNGQA